MQDPDPDCYFCGGTGTVLPSRVSPKMQAGRCLCTVSPAEAEAALPSLLQRMRAKAELRSEPKGDSE